MKRYTLFDDLKIGFTVLGYGTAIFLFFALIFFVGHWVLAVSGLAGGVILAIAALTFVAWGIGNMLNS